MSVLFRPGSTKAPDPGIAPDHPNHGSAPSDPTSVVRAALEALMLGTAVASIRSSPTPYPALGEFEITISNVVMDHADGASAAENC